MATELSMKMPMTLTFDKMNPKNYGCSPHLIYYPYSKSEIGQNVFELM